MFGGQVHEPGKSHEPGEIMDWETGVKKLQVLRHNELILSKTGHCWLLFVYVYQNLMTWYFKLLRNNEPLSCLYFTFICYDLNDD